MDVSNFKTSDWLKIGGGAVFFIAGFLTWWKVEAPGFSDGGNAFDWFFTGTLSWLIFTAIAVLTVLAATGKFALPTHLPAPLIYLAAAAFGFFLVLVRFISDGIDGDDAAAAASVGVDISRGVGLYLAVLAAIAVLVGCVMGFKESGGDLNDLKDFNKLKSAFGTGGSGSAGSPPPPPPSPAGGMPPPPPPV